MGMKTIYSRPRTSQPNKDHKKYPYLLRNLSIYQSNQVWCTDITYVPMPRGQVYLRCILDCYSRKVLSWEVSNTMDASLCQKALLRAIEQTQTLGYQTPDQFYQEGLNKEKPQEILNSPSLPQKNQNTPKVLVTPLQVLEATSLRSEALSNLPLTSSSQSSYIPYLH